MWPMSRQLFDHKTKRLNSQPTNMKVPIYVNYLYIVTPKLATKYSTSNKLMFQYHSGLELSTMRLCISSIERVKSITSEEIMKVEDVNINVLDDELRV